MKKFTKIFFIVMLSILYCVFIAQRICRLPINTDISCMILEAKDILSGNIFLSGWSLTGVSFLTTDLPFYIIGVAVFGVSINAYRLATILMFLFMMSGAVLLSVYGMKRKWLAFAIFAGFGLFPTYYALSNAFVHTAGFAFSFYAILLAIMYNENPTKTRLVLLGIISALAICGDRITAPLITVPLLVLCVFKAFKKPIFTAAAVTIGSALGIIIEKIYLFIGKADITELLHHEFTNLEEIGRYIKSYIEYFLKLINAYFFNKNIFSVKTAFFALRIFIVIFAAYLIYKAIKSIFLFKKADIPTAALGIGFTIVSLILLMTNMATDMTGGRYIAYLPLLAGIALARGIADNVAYTKVNIAAMVLISAVIAATNIIPKDIPQENTYHRLAEYLESEGLTHGYAPFWDSSVITVLSEERVAVRGVIDRELPLKPMVWFCKSDWYDSPAQFVIVRNHGNYDEEQKYQLNNIYNMHIHDKGSFDIKYSSVTDVFGAPKEIKEFENYSILVYDNIKFER